MVQRANGALAVGLVSAVRSAAVAIAAAALFCRRAPPHSSAQYCVHTSAETDISHGCNDLKLCIEQVEQATVLQLLHHHACHSLLGVARGSNIPEIMVKLLTSY